MSMTLPPGPVVMCALNTATSASHSVCIRSAARRAAAVSGHGRAKQTACKLAVQHVHETLPGRPGAKQLRQRQHASLCSVPMLSSAPARLPRLCSL